MGGFLGMRKKKEKKFGVFAGPMFLLVSSFALSTSQLHGCIDCSCAKLHQQLLPKSISKSNSTSIHFGLILLSPLPRMGHPLLDQSGSHQMRQLGKLHCSKVSVFPCHLMGRYWASGYFSRNVNRGKFWKASSDGFWCPRMPG